MLYEEVVSELGEDAEQLEQLYRSALKAGEGDAFGQAIAAGHAAEPDNLLYAAWYHRLRMTVEEVRASFVNWAWVMPLAVLNGLLFWWLSDDQRYMIEIAGSPGRPGTEIVPTLLVLAAPIIAVFVLIYLTVNGRRDWRLSAIIGGMLLAAAAYVLWAYPQTGTRPFQTQGREPWKLHARETVVAPVSSSARCSFAIAGAAPKPTAASFCQSSCSLRIPRRVRR